MKLAITGHTCMIGQSLMELLYSRGYDAITVDRQKWDLTENQSFDQLEKILCGADAVFHFGAIVPTKSKTYGTQDIFKANIQSCLCLGEWAERTGKAVIYLSGATVYKKPYARNIREEDEKTVNGLGGFYGFSKYLGEQILDHFSGKGVKIINLRPSSVYGGITDLNKLIPKFVSSAIRNESLKIEGKDNRINFIHASDVANAALQSFEAKAWGTYNIAGPELVSIGELAMLSLRIAGSGYVEYMGDDLDPYFMYDLNIEKAKDTFCYTPKVRIEDGIQDIFEKLKSTGRQR
jgi:UDP-glucose 4-epimerase